MQSSWEVVEPLGGAAQCDVVSHWGHAHKGDIGNFVPSSSSLFCFLATMKWTDQPHAPCLDMLPHHRPKSNQVNRSWTETCKTFSVFNLIIPGICYSNGKLLTRALSVCFLPSIWTHFHGYLHDLLSYLLRSFSDITLSAKPFLTPYLKWQFSFLPCAVPILLLALFFSIVINTIWHTV